MEKRLQELESRFAFQEHSIQELNDVIIRQQEQIDLLIREVRDLKHSMQEIGQAQMPGPGTEPPPPHY